MPALTVESENQGLTLKAHRGEGALLLAFDLDPSLEPNLAGVAVRYRTPNGDEHWLRNRLTFDDPVTAVTTPAERSEIRTPTNEAPLQKFHWTHFPYAIFPGDFTYTVTAMLFKPGSERELEPGPEASIDIDLAEDTHSALFTGLHQRLPGLPGLHRSLRKRTDHPYSSHL